MIQARTRYLSIKAPEADRPALVAVSNGLLACAAVAVALILGTAGPLHDIRTPLVILIAFNVVTALYARRAFADWAWPKRLFAILNDRALRRSRAPRRWRRPAPPRRV